MSTIEDDLKAFKAKVSKIEEEEKARQTQKLQSLKEIYSSRPNLLKNGSVHKAELDKFDAQLDLVSQGSILAQVNLTGDGRLNALDDQFISTFKLDKFLKTDLLRYPTVFCETLEEFFAPILTLESLSAKAKQEILQNWVQEAQRKANQGGIYGFNIPGSGCYLNGWLFASPHKISARKVMEQPELLRKVLRTAVHEKLGHGFLDVFSSLGSVTSALGAFRQRLAARFGLQNATDPVDRVREEQYRLLMENFILEQEGWATWIETFFGARIIGEGRHPRHSFESLIKAVASFPVSAEEEKEAINALKLAIGILLDDSSYPPRDILSAVNWIHRINVPTSDHFSRELGQPLCYALGELIMMKCEINLGTRCVPFAALIAANINFDPEKIGLADMRELFENAPDLSPDARLVLLSKLKLEDAESVAELADKAENILSFQVPPGLKVK